MNLTEMNRVSILGAAALGVPANGLFLWLILKRSPAEMAVYRRLLLQNCICDIVLLLLLVLTQPMFFYDGDIATMWFSGPLWMLPNPWNTLVNYIYCNLANASLWQPCAQFFYRYLLLTRNHQLSIRAYCAIVYGVGFLYVVNIAVPQFLPNSGPVLPCCKDPTIPEFLGVDNQTAANLTFAIRNNNPANAITNYSGVALDLANFALILFFRMATLRFLRGNMRQRSNRSASDLADLHRQLNLVLTLQAVFPFISVLTDVSLFAEAFAGLNFVLLDIAGFIPMYWLPAMAPLITICTVQRYRNIVFCRGQTQQQPVQQQLQLQTTMKQNIHQQNSSLVGAIGEGFGGGQGQAPHVVKIGGSTSIVPSQDYRWHRHQSTVVVHSLPG